MASTIYSPTQTTTTNTNNCSQYANHALPEGYRVRGDAWNRDGKILFNGYDGLELDSTNAMDHHLAAQQNLYKNFKSDSLDKNQTYLVNMYYKGSPYTDEAFADTDGNGIKGTHTGNLYYDEKSGRWKVEHNIHGKIFTDDFIGLQKPGRKYGVTAIQTPRKNNLFYRIYDWAKSLEKGGSLQYYTNKSNTPHQDMTTTFISKVGEELSKKKIKEPKKHINYLDMFKYKF